jgi:predicted TIM-barrel fold metal-dependent hydrolase
MPTIEELQGMAAFGGQRGRRAEITWLPEPPRQERHFTIVSADDHVVEPPDTFEGRLPKKYADEAPRVVELDDGGQAWLWQGQIMPNVGFNAVVGRPPSEYGMEPTRFDEMRRGAWDVDARVADMDLDGVYASLCFPSFLPGFVGQRLSTIPDRDLGLAVMRAYNDWHLEAWCGAHPGRFIPNQITWLLDPEIAAAEVRRNAERGFKAVTFSEGPDKLGLPSIHTGYWDPFFRACEETGTVLCLHVGSSGQSPQAAEDSPPEEIAVLFGAWAMFAGVDWLYSMVPVRFPDLKICLSEGGIGWVAGIIDRLDHVYAYQEFLPNWKGKVDLRPSEVFRRNFWFCWMDDGSGWLTRDVIGVENILVESDYPHADSSWPHTQRKLHEQLVGVTDEEIRRVTHANAAELFGLTIPQGFVA